MRIILERSLELFLEGFKHLLQAVLCWLRIFAILIRFLAVTSADSLTTFASYIDAWQPVTPGVFKWER